MPYVNFHNLTQKQIMDVSKDILEDIARIVDCPTDWFCFNGIAGFSIIDNELRDDVCYVKVEWFKRDEETIEKVTNLIDESLRKIGIKETVITFSDLDKKKYFEEGKRVE